MSNRDETPCSQESMTIDIETKNTYKGLCDNLHVIWTKERSPIGEEMFITQKLTQSLIVCCLFLSLTSIVRCVFGAFGKRRWRKQAVEIYAIGKAVLFFCLLLDGGWKHFPQWMVWYLMADLLVNLAAFVLLKGHWKEPASGIRSLILLAFNFLELTAAFAVLYLQEKALIQGQHIVQEGSTALYFSVITAATVGYGDVVAATNWGRELVTFQVFVSLGFVAVVLASFVSELGSRDNHK